MGRSSCTGEVKGWASGEWRFARGLAAKAIAHGARRDGSGVARISQEYREEVFSNLKFDVRQLVVGIGLRAARSQERRE
jgi:hypothetical protein